MNLLEDSFDVLSDHFPFSVFFGIKDIVESYVEGGVTATSTIDFPIRISGSTSSTVTISVLGSTGMSDAVGSTTKDMIFDIQGKAFWLGAVFIIVMYVISLV